MADNDLMFSFLRKFFGILGFCLVVSGFIVMTFGLLRWETPAFVVTAMGICLVFVGLSVIFSYHWAISRVNQRAQCELEAELRDKRAAVADVVREEQKADKPGPKVEPLRCSFCNKSQDEVKKLVAGPCIFICDECTASCNNVISYRKEHPAPEKKAPIPEDLASRCSFCNKTENEVYLVSGPKDFICEECVSVCNEILAAGTKESVSPDPAPELL